MDTFAKLTAAERKPYLEETASRRTSTNTAIEKDFWICWTLKHLFALTGIPELRFKGGTSLSKVFDLIERFSEDIDISLDRAALGFTGERDLANPKLSNTKRKELDLELRAAIEKEVKTNILPKLQKAFESILGKEGWTLAESTEPNEEMTLLFNYPPAFESFWCRLATLAPPMNLRLPQQSVTQKRDKNHNWNWYTQEQQKN